MQNYVFPALSSIRFLLYILSDLHSEHDDSFDGFDHPRNDAVVRCLKRLLELPRQAPIFLMVNALG